MISTLFAVFLALSLCMIVIGLVKQEESAQALIGFFFLFLLGIYLINGNIEYKSGQEETDVYTYSGGDISIIQTEITYTYSSYTNKAYGYWLSIAASIGLALTLWGLKGGFKPHE